MTVKDGLRLEMKIISWISWMDENVGGDMAEPLLGKLGGGRREQETGGGHGQSEERVVWKSGLGHCRCWVGVLEKVACGIELHDQG